MHTPIKSIGRGSKPNDVHTRRKIGQVVIIGQGSELSSSNKHHETQTLESDNMLSLKGSRVSARLMLPKIIFESQEQIFVYDGQTSIFMLLTTS